MVREWVETAWRARRLERVAAMAAASPAAGQPEVAALRVSPVVETKLADARVPPPAAEVKPEPMAVVTRRRGQVERLALPRVRRALG